MQPQPENHRSPTRVLVVENDATSRSTITTTLQSSGYSVIGCATTAEAETLLNESVYEAVIIDLHLPDKASVAILQTFQERAPNTKIILFTNQGNLQSAKAALHCGVFAYVEQSDGLNELAKHLGRLQPEKQRSKSSEPSNPLSQIAESIDEIFWLVTADLREIVYINPAFEKIWGRSCDSVYRAPELIVETIHPDDAANLKFALSNHDSADAEVEYRIVRPDGGIRYIQSRYFPVRNNDGVIVRLAGISRDITKHKTVAQALRESEENWRSLTELSPDPVLTMDRELRVQFCNEAAEQLTEETLIGTQLHLHASEDEQEGIQQLLEGVLETGKPAYHVSDFLLPNEVPVSFESRITPRISNDQVIGLTVNARDITTRRRTEERLKQADAKFQRLVEEMNGVVFQCDIETQRFTYVSPHAETLLGYPIDDWYNDPNFWPSHLHEEDRESTVQFCATESELGRDHVFEYRMIAADGSIVWLHDSVRLVRSDDGEVSHMHGIMLDITKRKEAEREHATHMRHLQTMNRVNQIIGSAKQVDDLLNHLLDELVATLGVSRAFVLHPCEPAQKTAQVFAERTSTDTAIRRSPKSIRLQPQIAESLREVLSSKNCVESTSGTNSKGDDGVGNQFREPSRLFSVINPSMGCPWVVCVPRDEARDTWTDADKIIMNAVSRRIEDAMSRMLIQHELQNSEQRYRSLADAAFDGILVYIGQEIVETNNALTLMCGFERSEIIGKSPLEFVTEDTLEVVREQMSLQSSDQFETQLRRKDGAVIDVEGVGRSIVYHGKPARIVAMRNVTLRKDTEAALRDSAQRFQQLSDNAFEGIAIIDRGVVVEANIALLQMFGHRRNNVIGKTALSLIAPETIDLAREKHQTRETDPYEAKLLCANGSKLDVEIIGRPTEYNGHVARVVAVRDITRRKLAEKALQESEALLRGIVDNSTAAIFLKDPDGKYMLVNRQYEFLVGVKNDEVVGKTDFDLFTEEAATIYQEHDQEVIKAGCAIQSEETVSVHDGLRTFISVKFPLLNSQGTPYAVCGIATDITARIKAEEDTLTLQAHLRHAQKMEAVGQLAAGVAHEFNNMLVPILGNAELLLTMLQDFPERYKHPIEGIERAGVRAAKVTKQLLSFARKRSHNVTQFDINELIAASRGMLLRFVGESVTLDITPAAEPAIVRADEAEIEQAVINLVINSRDAIENSGAITIQTVITELAESEVPQKCIAGPYVQLSISDSGCGISPENLERIFEPFFTTKPVGTGTGLGLSTVFSDVAKSGGFVTVESQVETGTTFRIHLPRENGRVPQPIMDDSRTASHSETHETILVCDDDEMALTSVANLLEAQGYHVIATRSGEEAIAAAESCEEQIQILVTDIRMPEMNGPQLAEQLSQTYPDLKILFTSGYGKDDLQLPGMEHAEFIQKPTAGDALSRRIRRILDSETPSFADKTVQ